MSSYTKGLVYAIATSATFGLIPLFTLPLMNEGLSFPSILFYRFLIATILLFGLIRVRRESLKVKLRQLPLLFLLGIFYTGSALFLFWGYGLMGAGLATAFHFTYPIFVSLLMISCFGEKSLWTTWLAIALALGGVACLSLEGNEAEVSLEGVFIVLLSALSYGLYIIAVNKSNVRDLKGQRLSFYVFLVSTALFYLFSLAQGGVQPLPMRPAACLNILLLALLPTVVSIVTLFYAIQAIGSTTTSVIGALELIVAVSIGVFLFGEPFSSARAIGFLLILSAVLIIILTPRLQKQSTKQQHPKEQ